MSEEILKKITRYNLFNYLLPGIIFIIFISKTTEFNIIELFNQNSIIILLFLAYFIGSIISRIGSLIVEPSLKLIKFIEFAKYKDYLNAVKKDNKIDDLSEENNTYRTYTSLFLIVAIVHIFTFIFEYFLIDLKDIDFILSILFLILFMFSYRKQTSYIRNRVNKNKMSEAEKKK